ncbi:MAG: hypothetical protein ACXVEF_25055 [Polyangiales bacterium]
MTTTKLLGVAVLVFLGGCGSSPDDNVENGTDTGADPTDTGTTPGDDSSSIDSGTPPSDSGTPPSDTGTSPSDTGPPPSDTGTSTLPAAGNPDGKCMTGVPAGGMPADVSKPTTVVGTGTAASCTFAALKTAVTAGGIITFNCGTAPVTIAVTATLMLPTTKSTVIDGGGKVILDGGGAVQILRWDSADFRKNDNRLTLQHLALINGKATPTKAIPVAPAPCSQGWNDGEGGALYMRDGNLTVIDSVFVGNQAAPRGPDTGGGAIYVLGSKNGALVVKSTFEKNKAANAGALGGLFCPFDIYDSLFSNNTATGDGANSDDATKCSVINNGQHEVGSGGNGGAIYNDGASVNVLLCGDAVLNNAAGTGAFGGGLFFTSNDFGGTLTIIDTTMSGNTGGHWTSVASGTTKDAGTAVGTNTKSLTITNSKLQGI